MGSSIVDWSTSAKETRLRHSDFDRQLVVVRESGQTRLADACVALVGLGGGGSHVAHQLAHMGVGETVAIDPDRVSGTDRHRLLGLTRFDVWLKRPKTAVIRRVMKQIGTGARCCTVTERVPGPQALEALKTADVIVGCVDNLHARLDLQEISWRFVIPYVDVGVSIRATDDGPTYGPRVAIGGNVLTLIPGGFCMWCSGFLTKEKLDAEIAGPNRSYFQNRSGEAQVVSLNGLVASQAATEVLQLLTGFAGHGIRSIDLELNFNPRVQRGFRKLDGIRGTLEDWGASRRPNCAFCRDTLATGAVTWF